MRVNAGCRLGLAAVVALAGVVGGFEPAGGQDISGQRLFGFVNGRNFRYPVSEYVSAQLWFATPTRMRSRVEGDEPGRHTDTWFAWSVRGRLLCMTGGGATNCFRLTPRVRWVKGKRVTDAVAVFTKDRSRYIWRRCVRSGRDVPIACRVLY